MFNIKIISFGRRKLKKFEEDLPRVNGEIWRLHMGKTGVGCDGFHPKVLLDLRRETRGEVVEGGTECETASASLHDNVLPEPEEWHE